MKEKKAARGETRERLLFSDCLATYVKSHVERRQLRSAPQLHAIMRDYVLPAFGSKLIKEITKSDVVALLESVADDHLSQANKVFDWLRSMMNFIARRGIIASSPLEGLERPSKNAQRDRVLSDWELQRVWEATHDLGPVDGPLIQTLILTGLRLSAVRSARWAEIDLRHNIWIIPKERSKSGRAILVPVTAAMIRMFDHYWPTVSRQGLLFATTRGLRSSCHLKQCLDRAVALRFDLAVKASHGQPQTSEMEPFVLHDLRRTMATDLQKLGVPIEHVEALLDHVMGSHFGETSLIKVYQLHKYAPEKRAALEKWHDYIEELMARDDAWPGGKDLPAS